MYNAFQLLVWYRYNVQNQILAPRESEIRWFYLYLPTSPSYGKGVLEPTNVNVFVSIRQVVGRGRFREGTGVECLGSLRALRRVTGRGVIPGYKVYLRLLMNRPSGVYSPLFTCLWGTVARRLVANEPPPVPRGGSTPSDGRPSLVSVPFTQDEPPKMEGFFTRSVLA